MPKTWFRMPTDYSWRPALWTISAEAEVMWIRGIAYSTEWRLDGFVPSVMLRHLTRRVRQVAIDRVAADLVEADLWTPTLYRRKRAAYNGFQIVDWADFTRPQTRDAIPLEVRLAVYARDGWCCRHCGATDSLSLDHVFPWSLGGSDDVENLQTLCIPCNSRKGAKVQ